MAVLVNFKICDNAKECGGVAVCPTGALSYDDNENTIIIDNDKCISCGLCEMECPIRAISVSKSAEEYEKIKKQIDDDPRTTKDLFVDRYGAVNISDFFKIEFEEINDRVCNSSLVIIELFNEDEAQCLLKSIPIKEIASDLSSDILYYKCNTNYEEAEKYDVKELPALLIYKSNKLIGKVEGYYTDDEKDEFKSKISNIIDEK